MRANRALFYLSLLLILGLFASVLPRANAEDQLVPDEEAIFQAGEKYEFQTEVSRLMNLIINSLYKTREIFLRELISNASDALDKIRFISLTDPFALGARPDLNITIVANLTAGTLTITDTGVGMTRNDLRINLGTIAKSGTSEFITAVESERKASNSKDDPLDLIGQFGVGFYSSFLVADRVTVVSKHNNDTQNIWTSSAVSDFTIAEDPRGNTLGRGTQIILHLKSAAREFLTEEVLRNVVEKYSEFINFPIYIQTSRTIKAPVASKDTTAKDEVEAEVKKDEDEAALEDEEEEEEEELEDDEDSTVTETVYEWELMNSQKPIWTRDSKEVTDTEYIDFYRSLTKQPEEPLAWTHIRGEGSADFRAIVYIPTKESEAFFRSLSEAQKNVRLFVKHVFITDELGAGFFPKWLSFARAIIDADDLPLNVSRETLQTHKLLDFIRRHIIKKALDLLTTLAKSKDPKKAEKFTTITKNFGTMLKLGAIEDQSHRKTLSSLLRFPSSHSPENATVSLDDYISRARTNQTQIYFATGSTTEEIQQSPFIERLLARGYEVLYMIDPIDEIMVQHMPGYNGKMFADVAKGDLKFGDEELEETESKAELSKVYEPLSEWLNDVLSEYVEKVVISNRLTTSPFAVVASNFGWTAHMESVMRAQAFGAAKAQDEMMYNVMTKQKKILEINPNHPVVESLLQKIEDGEVTEDVKEMVTILYETTAIRSGYVPKDMNTFTRRVETVVRKSLGVDLEAEAKVEVEVAPERTEEERKRDQEFFEAGEEVVSAEAERFELEEDDLAKPHDEL